MSDAVCRRLVGRTALITGGASGIGLTSAQRLASEGANVVIADMDSTAGEAAAAEVGGTFVQVNVTSPEDNDRMYKVAVDTYGSIDVAFHNAGISPPDDDSILDTGLEAWKRVQDVNLTSVYLGCKAVLPYMLEQIDHQRRIVRRDHGCGNVADLLHRIQGRSPVDVARAWRSVRAPGSARQCDFARTRQDTTPHGALREGSGARRSSVCSHPLRPLRRARGDRGGRGLPRL